MASKKKSVHVLANEAESRLRLERARLERGVIRTASKAQKAMLSVYQSADRGRRNKDWRASPASADASIIPDNSLLIPRARQLVRDTSLGKSVVKAFVRNVVRCGILPVSLPRDSDGALNADLAKQLTKMFWDWANDASACDAAREQTFWQMQSLGESERVTVGDAYWVWSYSPRMNGNAVDTRFPVGLKLQQIEAEQLASHLTEHQGNEVRGGIEVDEFGAMVAIHVYRRNPSDYLVNTTDPIRIPAGRVLRYKRKERVGQTRGVSDLAAVMQEIRDTARYKDATLWRAIMEACIGIVIKRPSAANAFGTIQPRASGDSGTTSGGMNTVDFTPGMTAFLGEGEDVTPFIPSSPGNGFEPFIRHEQRSVAAGVGIGYGQLTMDFTQGTYSGQRQEMLETRAEFEPIQELLAHSFVLPVWRLFVGLAISEKRIAIPANSDATSVSDAEYVTPPMPWIDPEKELNAWVKAIEQKLITREEIAAMRGMRLADVWERISAEQGMASKLGIVLPENKDNPKIAFKRDVVKAFIADGTVADVVANSTDIKALVRESGLTEENDYVEPWLPVVSDAGPVVTGEVLTDSEGDIVGGVAEASPNGGDQANQGIDGAASADQAKGQGDGQQQDDGGAAQDGNAAMSAGHNPNLLALAAKSDVPLNLRNSDNPAQACAVCQFFSAGKCTAYSNTLVSDAAVCDSFEPAQTTDSSAGIQNGRTVSEGQAPIDHPLSDFKANQ